MIWRVISWAVIASVAMVGGMVIATWWVERHPIECDAACKAQRAKQWQRMSN